MTNEALASYEEYAAWQNHIDECHETETIPFGLCEVPAMHSPTN